MAAVGERGLPFAMPHQSREQLIMTKNESFKQRIRQRMATTGERYTAARRSLLDNSGTRPRRRVWVSEPEFSDAVIR